jgi:hypothetical protein
MDRIKQWAGTFIVALALAVLLTRFAGVGTESADAASTKTLWIGSNSFVPGEDTVTWLISGPSFMGDGSFGAPIPLAAGKKIVALTVDYFDNNPSYELCAALSIDPAGGDSGENKAEGCTSGASASNGILTLPLEPPYKLLSSDIPYVLVYFYSKNSNLRVYNVGILYK